MGTFKRREILAMLAAIGAGGPAIAWELTGPVQERLPWDKFRKTGDFAKLVSAVRTMKANANAASPDSWLFWANIHQSHCPHGKDYFLAWHRGYLSLFEQQLRKTSGSSSLRLPYWDYFTDASVPEELTRGNAGSNPLFEARKGNQVGKALVYAAFGRDVVTFERGKVKNCFESNMEAFHNNVHNLIGGRMATMQSPQDIIFWMHHANVDRLWAAWTLAGQGRQMPAAGQPYWGGQLDYQTGMAVKRGDAFATEMLGYRYADLKMPIQEAVNLEGGAGVRRPTAVLGERGSPVEVEAAADAATAPPPPPPAPRVMAPPPAPAAAPAAAAPIPFRGIWLGRESRSIRMPLRRAAEVRAMPDSHHHGESSELSVVLDAVTLTQVGEGGGFFYKLYLDLDDLDYDQIPGEDRLLGTVGPFQIAAALNHAEGGRARIELPAADIVRKLAGDRDPEDLGVTFVRVDASNAPGGSVISIERVEFRGQLG
ncbi:MAG: tyrosinase family protein [Pseudomonadota bacterium]